jgi:hypothetical protein
VRKRQLAGSDQGGDFLPSNYAKQRDSASNLDYVVITWLSTGTPGGVLIVAKFLKYMVPATRFELVTP